jgi:endonuclease/exonuclease/phosphatase family metal-dependent hydrolase
MRSSPHAWMLLCFAAACAAAGGPSGDGPDLAVAPTDQGIEPAVDLATSVDAAVGPFDPLPSNVPSGPLCDIPPGYVAGGGDPTFISCALAADRFSDRDPMAVPAQLKVVAWNVEFGKASAEIKNELMTRAELKDADFLLLSEVSRASKTSNPQMLDQARELAQALKMDYAFAVEWDRREKPDELGEHGVAILSKYPLGNAQQIRHTPLNDWYAGDMLYGGRITLGLDALVGGRLLRLYASHLCTRGIGDAGRAIEGAEVRADSGKPGRPSAQVMGGDLNTWTCNPAIADCTKAPAAEQVVEDFLNGGWSDGTAGWNGVTQLGKGFFPQRLDWLFYRGTSSTPGMRVDASGSDHLPIFTRLSPP